MLSHARKDSQNAFDILTKKIRICKRLLKLNSENFDSVFLMTYMLHSYLRDANVQYSENCDSKSSPKHCGSKLLCTKTNIRCSFRNYFSSSMCRVEWQENISWKFDLMNVEKWMFAHGNSGFFYIHLNYLLINILLINKHRT